MLIQPAVKEKVLLLLLAGFALGYTHSPHKQWQLLRGMAKEWKKIDERFLREEIYRLYRSKLVHSQDNKDGTLTFELTEKGKIKALTYHFEEMKISKKGWDNKWRIIIFDIPERLRRARDTLRDKLKELGFYELQKSVFVFPYECKDEIDFVIEFFYLRKYVRVGVLETIDNQLHLKKIFNLV